MSPVLAGLFLLYNIIFRVATRSYDKAIKGAAEKQVTIRNRNTGFSSELLKNAIMVRTFRCFPFFAERFQNYEKHEQNNNLKLFMLQNSYDEVMWSSKKLMEIILPFGLGAVLMAGGHMTFAHVIAFTVANDLFSKGFNNLINAIISANSCIPHINAINEFMEEPEEETAADGDVKGLAFENVSFEYGSKTVLENVSFTIESGKWVQIIGSNGQGKSTLLQLMTGLYQPTSGQIHFEDETNICYIPQFSEIIVEGVHENIALEDSPDAQDCEAILEGLRISATDRSAPDRFSQGEKQRLMIARAIYHLNKKSLVLGDEIFANIDKQNRAAIAEYLSQKCAGNTVIMVCHEDMGMPFDITLRVENKQVTIIEGGALHGN